MMYHYVHTCTCAITTNHVLHMYTYTHPKLHCTEQQYGINVTVNNLEVVEKSEVIWLAVKPHAIGRVLREVTPVIRPDHLILSTAAGIPIKELEKVCKSIAKYNKESLLCLAHNKSRCFVSLLYVDTHSSTPV